VFCEAKCIEGCKKIITNFFGKHHLILRYIFSFLEKLDKKKHSGRAGGGNFLTNYTNQ